MGARRRSLAVGDRSPTSPRWLCGQVRLLLPRRHYQQHGLPAWAEGSQPRRKRLPAGSTCGRGAEEGEEGGEEGEGEAAWGSPHCGSAAPQVRAVATPMGWAPPNEACLRSAVAVRRMLFGGEHASHRCHQPTCINHEHIIVEGKPENEARKSCKGKVRCH